MSYRASIQHRFVLSVSLILLAVSLLTGGLVYHETFVDEIEDATSVERQLVRTVQSQAEVAVYALNIAIAEDIVDGLRANPRILGVRIAGTGSGGFHVGAGATADEPSATVTAYRLHSPVDGKRHIGQIEVTRNDTLIRAEATMSALWQALLMVSQVLVAAILMILFFRHLIGQPVARLADALAALKPGSGARIQVDAQHRDDEIGSLAASANALIQAAEDALAEARSLATTDSLTGLPNRRAFMASIEDEHARIQRYGTPNASILMLDLDHFKQLNDRHGHAAGDAALRWFGAQLAAALRKIDIAGRLGGEEFAILLPGSDRQAGAAFAERLRSIVASSAIPHAGTLLQFTVSIGITELTASDAHPDDALGRADAALYRAKEEGRDRVALG